MANLIEEYRKQCIECLVLLTRGMRGTFIYCEDEALNNYIKPLLEE